MGRDDPYWQHREEDSFTRRRKRDRGRRAPVPAELAPPPPAPTPAILARPRPVEPSGDRTGATDTARVQAAIDAAAAEDDGKRDCAVGRWCRATTITRNDDGEVVGIAPARSYQAACPTCLAATAEALRAPERDRSDLLTLYVHLSLEIGKLGGNLGTGHAAFGPRLNLRGDVDALMRSIAITLVSWHARVAALPQLQLTVPDMRAAVAQPGPAIQRAINVLHPRLGALVALGPAEMERTVDGWVDWPELDGGDACREILGLYEWGRRVMGEVSPRPEELLGVRCYQCQRKMLVRADPPQRDSDLVYYSRCRRCGHLMQFDEYRRHVRRLIAVAQGRVETPSLAQ